LSTNTGGATTTSRPRRRRWLLWSGLALLVLVIWGGYAALQLLQARREAQAGIDHLEQLRETMSADSLLSGTDLAALEDASERFANANDHATNPALAPMRFVPFVGRQVDSADELTAAAEDVTNIAIDRLDRAEQLVDAAESTPAGRVALAGELSTIAGDAHAALTTIDLGPQNGLVGPLDRARRRFADELDSLQGSAQNIATAGASLEQLLRGPGRYLLFAANNAEMRVGAPSFLSVGVLSTQDGGLALGDVRSVTNFPLAADAVPLSGDMADRWGWLLPNAEWRNLMSSPRFDANAQLATQMWQASTGETVDGVIALDVVALRGLLRVTGPVQVDGREVGPDNVLRQLMVEQYRGVDTRQEVVERRDRLSDVAHAVLDRINQGDWDLVDLVEQLTRVAEGRHLMMWSAHEDQQAGWEAVRVAGELGPDSLMLGVHNRSGNKLDQFLAVDADVTADRTGEDTRVTVRVRLRNDTPTDLPPYVTGPFAGAAGAVEGRYQGLVVLNLPARAGAVEIGPGQERVAAGPDGEDSQVIASYVELDRGQAAEATFAFTVAGDGGRLRIEPSARQPSVTWTVGNVTFDDRAAREIVIADHVA
jgi:hypothetical protein